MEELFKSNKLLTSENKSLKARNKQFIQGRFSNNKMLLKHPNSPNGEAKLINNLSKFNKVLDFSFNLNITILGIMDIFLKRYLEFSVRDPQSLNLSGLTPSP